MDRRGLEQGIPAKSPDTQGSEQGISPTENMIAHVIDVGANYWSLWNFHAISAKNLLGYYQAFPKSFDQINRRIGYRVRPSMIWSYEDNIYLGLIIAFANDGIAGVPGVLRVSGERRRQGAEEWLLGFSAIPYRASSDRRNLWCHREQNLLD